MLLSHIVSDLIELNIKTSSLDFHDIHGHIEIDYNTDMIIRIDQGTGKLDFNAMRSTSQLIIKSPCTLSTVSKGIKTRIIYEGNIDEDSNNQIEFNGIMSELTIKKGMSQ